MTLDEKLGQLVQRAGGRSSALNSRLDEPSSSACAPGDVGSYLHVAGAEPLGRLQQVAVEESRLGIPLLFAMDVVHGYRTIFPVPLAMAATWEPESAGTRRAHRRATRPPPPGCTGPSRRWSTSRAIRAGAASSKARARIRSSARAWRSRRSRGYQGGNALRPGSLMATAKHFGAYGAADGGRDYDSADISERTLQEVYLPPFYAAAHAGLGLVHGRVQRHRAACRPPPTANCCAARCASAGAGRA